MTAVAEQGQQAKQGLEGGAPSEAQLLDVLYEVLAQGAVPNSELSPQVVEAFLHEHAREKKPMSELLAFFEKHDLPTDPGAFGCDAALRELAGGLHREHGPISSTFLLDSPTPSRVSAPQAPADTTASHHSVQVADASPVVMGGLDATKAKWLLVAMGLCVFSLGGALVASFHQTDALEQRLNEARLQQLNTDSALGELTDRAARLTDALAASEAERKVLGERFQAFVSGDAEKWEVEQAALSKVLGNRLDAARQRARAKVSAAATR